MATAEQWVFALSLLSALGSGLMAGVFFAFSAFVMKALARLPAANGIVAMQSINVAVINPLFMAVILGTAAVSLVLLLLCLTSFSGPGGLYPIAGSVLYLVGTFAVTFVFNVPRNNALAAMQPTAPHGAAAWAGYVAGWTAWNHARTIAALAAPGLFCLALRI
jgi:uncharacterized membrane protein